MPYNYVVKLKKHYKTFDAPYPPRHDCLAPADQGFAKTLRSSLSEQRAAIYSAFGKRGFLAEQDF
ncbi:hypothetical protein ALQ34_101258 [Pseudomonas syringae pv. maculicola]|nr:hypothetical protein ALQ34_101258 [Pseudomonas syringae pv. maculicola]